jgi:guanyl-specific ribonuclease Sa
MKRILSLLLVLAVLFGLAGCAASNLPPETTLAAESTATTQVTTAPEETEAPTQAPTTQPETEPTEKPVPKPTQPKPTESTLPPQTDPPLETQPPIMPPETEPETQPETAPTQSKPQKSYTHKDEVAQYIHEHGHLPDNFITKKEAKALGWRSGSLERYAPGKCIGGDRFYNREGLLPAGHTYYECDIDTLGSSSRGAKRIVFSTDGLIYYTSDHYRSFTLLYGEP